LVNFENIRIKHILSLLVNLTLYGRVRYPLCGRCRCRPMQPMGGRQFAPEGMRCSGTGGLYSGAVEILYGPGIAGDNFRLFLQKVWWSGDIYWATNKDSRIHQCPYACMLGNHQARLIVLSLLGASELQTSWPLRCSDRISPPIIAKSMRGGKGLGEVG
jgi:hypothetical protein